MGAVLPFAPPAARRSRRRWLACQPRPQPCCRPHPHPLVQSALWRHLFLPIVPPTFVLLQALAIKVMRSTEDRLAMLRAAQYDYKRA